MIRLDQGETVMNNQAVKALRRSRRNRVFAGVCGGLEEFFGISAFWFRLGFFIAAIPGGVPGVGLYVLLWLIIPSA
jgi:phage shock protein C